jgi:hypothetical protein
MDLSLSDIDMYECENGHTFCYNHTVNNEELEKRRATEDSDGNSIEPELDDDYSIPAQYCPCCTFSALSDSEMLKYLLVRNNLDRKLILEEIKSAYSSYKSFAKFIGKKK